MSREEKARQTRGALIASAIKVVGERGYMSTMVSEVTQRAGVAQGTFYNYFESRDELFDQLLPSIGLEMLEFIRQESSSASNALEIEELSFRAFFTFLKVRPEFYRILYEAEVFAPDAFAKHMLTVAQGYTRLLQRAAANGELDVKEKSEIEALAYLLMGARHYFAMQYAARSGNGPSIPEWAVRSYMSLISRGVFRDLAKARAPEAPPTPSVGKRLPSTRRRNRKIGPSG